MTASTVIVRFQVDVARHLAQRALCKMKMRMSDDDDDWSIEIFDGPCTKPVKQTPPTNADPASSKPKEAHPFFSRDVEVASAKQSKTTGRAPDAHRTLAPVFTVVNRHPGLPTLTGNDGKASSRTKTTHALESNVPPYQPVPLSKNPSSSSSIQKSSGSKTDEEELPLPVYSFLEYKNAPSVVYTKSESEANSLVQTLKSPLGFDLEWRVIWCPGAPERRTALVQLCDHDTILLIQVSSMKRFPAKVLEVIESANVVKLGANVLNDGEKLYRDFGIRARGLVELGALATMTDANFRSIYNRNIVSLAKMVAMYLGRTLPKGKVRTSNWEANLSDKMVEYAANDCHCALMVHDRLQEIAFEAGNVLDALACGRHVDPRTLKFKSVRSQTTNGPALPNYCMPEPPRPQQLRAYKLWHVDGMPLDQMCMTLRWGDRVEPLKESTVISYVVGALQGDLRLPFDMDRLKVLVRMEAGSWQRHRQWIASRE